MTVKFGRRDSEPPSGLTSETEPEGEIAEPEAPGDADEPRLRHSHDSEGRYNHVHEGGDRPHLGHAEDGTPIFETPQIPDGEDESGCPKEPHLHVVANRRNAGPLLFLPFGGSLFGEKDPWNYSSHCPKCGTLVQDRNSRRFRCSSEGCDGGWEVTRDRLRAARSRAMSSPIGQESILLEADSA